MYSLSSTKPNSMLGFNGSGSSSVSTPYIGESLGKIHNSSASTMYKAYPNVARNNIERGQRDDSTSVKKSRKYSSLKEKHVMIILLGSRRLNKFDRLPTSALDYALFKKNNQIIDDYTLTTAESFDNLLGSNNFSCEWTSYFFYDRRGN